jgi:hypothetical protein
MIRKILIPCFFLLTSITYFAQTEGIEYLPSFDKNKIHFGFYLGINQNDFKVSLNNVPAVPNANITVEPTAGFNVGLIADLRLHKNLSLRFEPGLMTNAKKVYFNHLLLEKDSVRDVSSTYLHVPFLLKFSTDRYKNIRPYLLAGVSYNYNFSSNEDNQADNFSSQFRMKKNNFMYEVGVGIDIYLYYFKFSPSIRGIFAINNEIKYDNPENGTSQWTAPVNYMGTRGVFLTFAFE